MIKETWLPLHLAQLWINKIIPTHLIYLPFLETWLSFYLAKLWKMKGKRCGPPGFFFFHCKGKHNFICVWYNYWNKSKFFNIDYNSELPLSSLFPLQVHIRKFVFIWTWLMLIVCNPYPNMELKFLGTYLGFSFHCKGKHNFICVWATY